MVKKNKFLADFRVNRKNTNSVKWDSLKEQYGDDKLLPLWVADMDFKAPKAVTDTLIARVQHGVFGYSTIPDSYYDAFFDWQRSRYGIELHKEWMRFGTGVVNSLYQLVDLMTEPGDSVLVQTPVYYPFYSAIEDNNRRIVRTPLKHENNQYEMDFETIERDIKANHVKLLIHCSPHNPVGRVWTEPELTQLFEICRENKVMVISDEIHQDLIVGKKPFVSALSIDEGRYRDNMVVVNAPSKTFNLAALQNSHIIIPNAQLRAKYDKMVKHLNKPEGSLMGCVAGEAAYRSGAVWLDEILSIVRTNYLEVSHQLVNKFPEIKISELEGTYLMWIDLSAYVNPSRMKEFIQNECGLAIDYGQWFSEESSGFIRMNLATDLGTVQTAVDQLLKGLKSAKLNRLN